MGQKRHPRHLVARASNGSVGEEIEDSDEEFVVVAKHDFKRCTRPPKGHFEKVLEATCPHHPYPIMHKLRDCTMMKTFMSLADALPGDDELTRNPRSGGMVLGEVEVVTITSRPRPTAKSAMWLAGARGPTRCGRNPNNGRTYKISPTLYAVPYGGRKWQRQSQRGKCKTRQVQKIYYTNIKQEKQNFIAGKHWRWQQR
jgi:hypothetical protein